MDQRQYFNWMRRLAQASTRPEEPKDYPMGRVAQIMYAYRKVFLWSYVALFVAATAKFAMLTLGEM